MKKDNALFRETKSHGSKDYPIEYYENAIPESYQHMQPHWHEEFEISKINQCYMDLWALKDPHDGNELLVKSTLFSLFLT